MQISSSHTLVSTVVLTILIACSVHCQPSAYTLERAASRYLVDHVFPNHPVLAVRLLSVLLKDQAPLLEEHESSEEESEEVPEKNVQTLRLVKLLRQSSKRGLGDCINACLAEGKLNFIRCKSMCH